MQFHRFLAVAAASSSSALAAQVQDEPLCAERPGLATPTCTIPAGAIQIEVGLLDWTHSVSNSSEERELVVGETAVKFGISDRAHLEVAWSPYVRSRTWEGDAKNSVSGFGDLTLAAKVRLTRSDMPVQLAVKPYVEFPTADDQIGNGTVEGGLIVPIDYSVPHSPISIGLSPEVAILGDEDGNGRHVGLSSVLAVSASLTDRLTGAAEIYGSWERSGGKSVKQFVLGGSLAYLFLNTLQFDVGMNAGLNRDSPDLELYSGVPSRF